MGHHTTLHTWHHNQGLVTANKSGGRQLMSIRWRVTDDWRLVWPRDSWTQRAQWQGREYAICCTLWGPLPKDARSYSGKFKMDLHDKQNNNAHISIWKRKYCGCVLASLWKMSHTFTMANWINIFLLLSNIWCMSLNNLWPICNVLQTAITYMHCKTIRECIVFHYIRSTATEQVAWLLK